MISTKNLSITDGSKNYVKSEPLNNSKSLLNDQQNLALINIRPGLKTSQESYLDKSILTQSEISLICL